MAIGTGERSLVLVASVPLSSDDEWRPLSEGELVVAGKKVRPQAIKGTALLTIEGELDDISEARMISL